MHVAHDALHELGRAGRAGHDAGAQAGEVKGLEIGVFQLGDEHGRHAVERRAAFVVDGFQRSVRVEVLGWQHTAGTGCCTDKDGDHHAEAVVEGHRDAEPVLLREVHRHGCEPGVVEDVVMRQHHGLWKAGRARGVLDIDGIVDVELGGGLLQRFLRDRFARL